jgi:hypothetical protein
MTPDELAREAIDLLKKSGNPKDAAGARAYFKKYESIFSYETIRELTKMGHKIQFSIGNYGGYQAILYDSKNKVYFGASESRKDGMAAGY